MHQLLEDLIASVDAALSDETLGSEREMADAMASAMRSLVAEPASVPDEKKQAYQGGAVGWLLHDDPEGRFHILSVVFPEGTSSGAHFHGCWGVIGYMHGGDEETRFRSPIDGKPHAGDEIALEEVSRHIWHQGDVTYLLPPADGWHRVRNSGPGTGVSIHVLCRHPAKHPHLYWDPQTNRVLDFPFKEPEPGVWRAEVEGL